MLTSDRFHAPDTPNPAPSAPGGRLADLLRADHTLLAIARAAAIEKLLSLLNTSTDPGIICRAASAILRQPPAPPPHARDERVFERIPGFSAPHAPDKRVSRADEKIPRIPVPETSAPAISPRSTPLYSAAPAPQPRLSTNIPLPDPDPTPGFFLAAALTHPRHGLIAGVPASAPRYLPHDPLDALPNPPRAPPQYSLQDHRRTRSLAA